MLGGTPPQISAVVGQAHPAWNTQLIPTPWFCFVLRCALLTPKTILSVSVGTCLSRASMTPSGKGPCPPHHCGPCPGTRAANIGPISEPSVNNRWLRAKGWGGGHTLGGCPTRGQRHLQFSETTEQQEVTDSVARQRAGARSFRLPNPFPLCAASNTEQLPTPAPPGRDRAATADGTMSLRILSFSIRSFSFFCSRSVLAWYVATALVSFWILPVTDL